MEKLIATLDKNTFENLLISIGEYKGRDLLSLRVWTKPTSVSDAVCTRKGITVSARMLPQIIGALREAERVAQEAGLLRGDDSDDEDCEAIPPMSTRELYKRIRGKESKAKGA